MSAPLAVSTSTVTPGLYISINLLSGAAAPGGGELRVLLLAPKLSAGDLTVDTEIREGAGPDSAATAFGTGGIGHLAAKIIYLKAPAAQIDFGAPTAGAGTATLALTASGVPTSNNSVEFDIAGREISVEWNASETADTFKARAITAIVGETQVLPVTAVSGGVGIITVNGKGLGNPYNDVLVKASLGATATGTEAIAGAATHTNLAGGTTDADFTTILAAAAGREYAYILCCMSNADTVLAGASSNLARVLTHIGSYNSGLNAKLQQAVVATTSSSIASTTTAALARNSQVLEFVFGFNCRSLPCEIAARELGGRLYAVGLDPAANRIGEVYDHVYGSATPIADTATTAELESALTSGISILSYNSSGSLYVVRPITNYSTDAAGGADRRLLDVQNVDGTYAVVRDLRSALPIEFAQAKIQPDAEPGDEPPPRGVSEERDIKAFIISRMRSWARQGVILNSFLDEVILDGSLIVEVNETDPSQVDIVVPMKIVPPLAKMGVVAQRRSN